MAKKPNSRTELIPGKPDSIPTSMMHLVSVRLKTLINQSSVSEHVEGICMVDKKRVLQRLRERNDNGDVDEVNGVDPCSGDCASYLTQPTLVICGGRLFDQMSAQVSSCFQCFGAVSVLSRRVLAIRARV